MKSSPWAIPPPPGTCIGESVTGWLVGDSDPKEDVPPRRFRLRLRKGLIFGFRCSVCLASDRTGGEKVGGTDLRVGGGQAHHEVPDHIILFDGLRNGSDGARQYHGGPDAHITARLHKTDCRGRRGCRRLVGTSTQVRTWLCI